MESIKCVSIHSESLADGRNVPVGEVAHDVDLTLPENERLLEEGRIIVVDPDAEPKALAGEALTKRAIELDIPGRTTMSAEELRNAVSAAESELAADDKENATS